MASVLIADDEPSFREGCASFFRRAGWKAFTAENGQRALEVVAQRPGEIDAIILDRNMPDGPDGDEVVRELYNRGVLDQICVVMVTAYANLDSAVDTLQAGAWQYLVKPVVRLDSLVKLLAPGVAFKKCATMQATILASSTLEDALSQIRAIIQDTLRPDVCEVIFLSDQYPATAPTVAHPEQRAFITSLLSGKKAYVTESQYASVQPLDPVLKENARSLMAVPVFRNGLLLGASSPDSGSSDKLIGVLDIESRDEFAFSPRWIEVLRRCADLIGMYEAVRTARIEHDFLLLRELRHRLATSVHVLMSEGSAMERATGTPPAVDSSIRVFLRHVGIVNSVLQEAKQIIDGPRIRELQPANVEDVVVQVVRDCESFAKENGVSLEVASGLNDLIVRADAETLAYALTCVVRNAVEATQARRQQDSTNFEPKVTISARGDNHNVRICIQDFGVGFSTELGKRLFNALFSTKTGMRNDGIGLYSVRRMIEGMGGRISASSPGPLEGATVKTTLQGI